MLLSKRQKANTRHASSFKSLGLTSIVVQRAAAATALLANKKKGLLADTTVDKRAGKSGFLPETGALCFLCF